MKWEYGRWEYGLTSATRRRVIDATAEIVFRRRWLVDNVEIHFTACAAILKDREVSRLHKSSKALKTVFSKKGVRRFEQTESRIE